MHYSAVWPGGPAAVRCDGAGRSRAAARGYGGHEPAVWHAAERRGHQLPACGLPGALAQALLAAPSENSSRTSDKAGRKEQDGL